MRLDRLLGGVEVLETRGDPSTVDVRAVTYDSRRVRPGALFCCLPGARSDGHDHAPAAVAGGAAALLCERFMGLDVCQARVAPGGARPAMAVVSSAFFGHPSRQLTVVGTTGTNGKTTVTHMVRSILEAHGWPTCAVGTLSGARTTPEAPELQEILAAHRDAGGRAAALEVSSHAIDQHRVDGLWLSAAVFTNLSHEHLDYHGTMEAYFDAKARIFEPGRAALGVVNADDEWGRRLLERGRIPLQPYSMADAAEVEIGLQGSRFRWRGVSVTVRLGGGFNVLNALAAATAAEALGVPAPVVADGLAALDRVPGRMEPVVTDPFTVLVDYAHTPDGLAEVLGAARGGMTPGARLVVVFGCGGDRDRQKRPQMGGVAARLADLVVLTSDNPRSEDPLAILDEVRAGAGRPDVVVEPDRRQAIRLAVTAARPGDVVVVAGKGHETGQEISGVVHPFDDRVEARHAVEVWEDAR
ncbi:MAG TPA: UDP-N-acetylmuramoyl-L-alanyl-D-glutamate--2,6-diaminopimelate ligase [Acidimicrobiales bacterium]|nr:UDP-N-acetylmuramoyl-L-alanyl-D-glutamate--2,6-diaminopimelate ligase [Acidimicrobiales bacterium]